MYSTFTHTYSERILIPMLDSTLDCTVLSAPFVVTGLVDALFLGSTRDTTTKWLRVWVVDQQNRHFLGSTSDIEAVTTHTKVSMSRVDEQIHSLTASHQHQHTTTTQ